MTVQQSRHTHTKIITLIYLELDLYQYDSLKHLIIKLLFSFLMAVATCDFPSF